MVFSGRGRPERSKGLTALIPLGGGFKAKTLFASLTPLFCFLRPYKSRAFDGFQKQKSRMLSHSDFLLCGE